jgi:peptide/nickel transport system substrate-binding protein
MVGYFYNMKLLMRTFQALFLSVLLNGCWSSTEDIDKTVFYYNESGSVKSLDPAFSNDLESMWIINQLFDGLVGLDSNLIPQPLIAHSWNISADQKTYQFHLRNNVWFHHYAGSKRRVKASDFVFSFERIINSELASPGKWIFDACIKEQPFVAINDSTLEIKLQKPQGSFLQLLSTVFANVVLPEAVLESAENFRTHPIGTGPFEFKFWETDVAMVLHKNAHYWMKDNQGKSLPYLDAVKIDFVKDVYAEFQGLRSGKYDFMSGLDANFIDELLTPDGQLVSNQDELKMYKMPFIKTDYIGFLLDEKSREITQDKDYRKLIYFTTPRQKICQLRNNLILPANQGFVPPTLLSKGYFQKNQNSNKNTVDSLLHVLHERWGNPLPSVPLTITPEYTDIFEMMQKHWSKLGINIQIQVLQSSIFKDAVAKGKVTMFRKNWLADYADAENFLQIFRRELWSPAGANYTHYFNPQFEKLYNQSSELTNLEERHRYQNDMEEIVLQDYPVIPLYYDQVVHFVNKRVKNWGINGVNQIDLTKVQKVNLN